MCISKTCLIKTSVCRNILILWKQIRAISRPCFLPVEYTTYYSDEKPHATFPKLPIGNRRSCQRKRIRPILMVSLMGSMGLLTAALSSDMGSEIQKPLTIMIVGGIIVCMLFSFTVLPQVFYFAYCRDKRLKKG